MIFSDPVRTPMASVCGHLYDDLANLARRLDAAIDEQIPEFAAAGCAFTAGERFGSTRRCTADFLQGVAEGRPPTSVEIERRAAIGREAAARGFPLQPMIGSFYVAYRGLWAELVDAAVSTGGEAPSVLLGTGSRIWEWMHVTVNAVAEGFGAENARIEAVESRALEHLLAALDDDAGVGHDARLASATSAGLDGGEPLRVLATRGAAAATAPGREFAALLEARGAIARRAQRGISEILIVQGASAELIDEIARGIQNGAAVGIGTEASGISGLLDSLHEAECALARSLSTGRVCHFESDWLLASIAGNSAIERLLQPGVDVARAHPHLADAMRAFAESLSMADGARKLRVSHNSFRYRLTRWRALTGWSPWTFDGLARSVASLDLAEQPTQRSAGARRQP